MGQKVAQGSATLSKELVDEILNQNRTSDFDKLIGVPGICLQPLPWDVIKQLVLESTERSLGQLGRSPAGIVVYRQFRKKILEIYAGIGDYIKTSVLHFDYALDPEGKRVAVEGSSKLQKPAWRENDFPYNFEAGITHHNVWFTRPLSETELQKEIEATMPDRETLCFINPVPLASIPSVWHAHIVSRAKKSANGIA